MTDLYDIFAAQEAAADRGTHPWYDFPPAEQADDNTDQE